MKLTREFAKPSVIDEEDLPKYNLSLEVTGTAFKALGILSKINGTTTEDEARRALRIGLLKRMEEAIPRHAYTTLEASISEGEASNPR